MALDKNAVAKEAQKFAAKGQFDKAIAEWKKLQRETPNDPNVYNTIGDLCLKKDARADAVDAYKTAADILAGDGFTSKAIALYKKVLNIDTSRMDVHLALGDMNAEKGLTGNALENYKFVADHYLKNNKMAEALGIYLKMADMSPANAVFRIKLAEMYAKEGMKQEATKAYLVAADIHVSKNSFQDARHLFEKALALDPNNKEVYHRAGIVYLKEGKFVEACKALKPAFENNPSNQELVGQYLEALSKAGKEAETEEVFKKLLKLHPDNVEQREKLFEFYLSHAEYEKALAEASALVDAKAHKGTPAAADKFLKAIVTASPQFVPGRKKLAEFYVSLDQIENAAQEFLQVADILIESGREDDAKEVLARTLEIMPTMPEARQRLKSLSQSAAPPAPEFTAPGSESIVEQQPESVPVQEPETILEHQQPSVTFEPPDDALEITPPVAAPPVAETDSAVLEAFTEVDVLIKYGLADKAIEQLESLASKFPENPRIRMKLRDLYHEQRNNDKAVLHALLAVALYTKYGREDLAESVLRSTQEMAPDHPAVVARLRRADAFSPEEPVFEPSVQGSLPPQEVAPAEFLPPKVMPDELAVDTTYTEPATSAFDEMPSSLEPAPTGENAFEGLDSDVSVLEAAMPADILPAFEIPAAEPFIEEVPAAKIEQPAAAIPEEPCLEAPLPPAVEMDQPVAEIPEEPVVEAPLPPAVEMDQPVAEMPEEPVVEAPQPPAVDINQPFADIPEEPVVEAQQPLLAPIDINEIWAEAEFYFQQGLFDEAKKLYANIIGFAPGYNQAIERLAEISREQRETQEFTRLAKAVDDLESALAADESPGEMTLSQSDEEAVRSLMREIQQLKGQEKLVRPPDDTVTAATAQEVPRPAMASQPEAPRVPAETLHHPPAPDTPTEPAAVEDYLDLGSELQAESSAAAPVQGDQAEEFFDLAAELRDELSSATPPDHPAASDEDQSLEDIFEEFKKGVEQQAVKEDADTHYNLGVAYKEMGLLDDAIAEFILTPEDESKFIQSRYMLGLCYMEKGEYRSAIGEIQNALDYSVTMGEDRDYDLIGMHYDLGLAYQGAGNTVKALDEFVIVARANPRYRDIVAKVKELKKGGHISLDRIKDDIEKEISSQFFKEGARIEKEEITKRNEKVKH